jgi:competence protein ComEC
MRRAYGLIRPASGHPLSLPFLTASAGVVAVAAHQRSMVVAPVLAVVAWASTRRFEASAVRALVVIVLLTVAASWRADGAQRALLPDELGPYEGWVRLVDDPQPFDRATRVIFEVEGERFETWIRGRARQIRAGSWRGGEYVHVSGERVRLDTERAGRVAWQHVVGGFDIEWASDVRAGSGVDRASNRVRSAIERGASALPGDDGSLFRGLVVGDDRDQPSEMIDRFRASGLSHLTAVSGQNVAFVLAAAGPLLRVLRPWWRWAVTLALIGWFVSLTRFEPSIVRAGAMASLSATAFVLGRLRSPSRLLALAVIGLVLVDPLLVRSVGFWLSVGATGGVATIGPWLAARLGWLGPMAMPVGVTLGAQVGVIVPALLVFGRLPLVSVPANLLAVPVAGFVMLYGLPAGLVAGFVPPLAPVVMLPCRVGVRWVDTVAVLAARVEPSGSAVWIGWGVLVAAVGAIAAMNRGRHGSPSADR